MKTIKRLSIVLSVLLLTIFVLSSCQLFLGDDPDDNPRGIFETIWNDFDRTYALFEHKNIDWQGVYNKYSPLITDNMSQSELFSALTAMLSELMDDHVWLDGRGEYHYEYDSRWPRIDYGVNDNFNFNTIRDYHVDFTSIDHDGFSYGTFESNSNIGYLRIHTFSGSNGIFMETGDWAKEIDSILQSLADTDGLVLDVRNNGGGFPSNFTYIHNRFASQQADYLSVSTKTGPGRNEFSTPLLRTIKPADTRYTKPTVLLTNGWSVSSTESFTLALRTQEHITHVGTNTNGALSTRVPRPLINGWYYTISIQRTADIDGVCYERSSLTEAGIPPEILIPSDVQEERWDPVWNDEYQIWDSVYTEGYDKQLEGALDELLKKIN